LAEGLFPSGVADRGFALPGFYPALWGFALQPSQKNKSVRLFDARLADQERIPMASGEPVRKNFSLEWLRLLRRLKHSCAEILFNVESAFTPVKRM
jgi:hypothetical protein